MTMALYCPICSRILSGNTGRFCGFCGTTFAASTLSLASPPEEKEAPMIDMQSLEKLTRELSHYPDIKACLEELQEARLKLEKWEKEKAPKDEPTMEREWKDRHWITIGGTYQMRQETIWLNSLLKDRWLPAKDQPERHGQVLFERPIPAGGGQ